MPGDFDETTFFRYARRIDGSLEPIDIARRNGKLMPRFDPSWTDPIAGMAQSESDLEELIAELTYNLNPLECRTWLKLIDGTTVEQIAETEGVSRSAVYERIRGNSKNQGGMVKKNAYVRHWWNLRQLQKKTL